MSEKLIEELAKEAVSSAAPSVAEKLLDKTFEVVSGRFRKKAIKINLSFGILFQFYDKPRYDECLLAFQRILKDNRETNEILKWKSRQYLHTLHIRQEVETVVPMLSGKSVDFEEYLSESILASSVMIYFSPIVSDETSLDGFEQIISDTYQLLGNLDGRSRGTNIRIRNIVKFIRIVLDENSGLQFTKCLRDYALNFNDYADQENSTKVIEMQIHDSSAITDLTNCFRGLF